MSGRAEPVGVGVVGCGYISAKYLENIQQLSSLRLVACADLDAARAEAKAAQFGVKALPLDGLLADPSIELVLNLTVPRAHADVAWMALNAGKHVYNEKPLSVSRDAAREVLELAQQQHLLVGCAPDTFLGGGLQTCRKLIDDGWIGDPVAATASILIHGHESWHPDPAFFYQQGGGPMLDVGPYYVTALVALLGPVCRVAGSTRMTFAQRTITSQLKYGTTIDVAVPTHFAGVLDFAQGAVATLVTSFDVWSSNVPLLEVYGTQGSLSLPDPNEFGGPVRLRRAGSAEWREMPLSHGNTHNARGLGLADMAVAIRSARPHRANGALAYHVLDVMEAVDKSSRESRHVEIGSTCMRPAPMPLGLRDGLFDS